MPDSLTVTDNRTGQTYDVPIENGAIRASAFEQISAADGDHGLLVYDQHNVIFAYGPLDDFKLILESRGFHEAEFWFPAPHAHSYLPENDDEEERLPEVRIDIGIMR